MSVYTYPLAVSLFSPQRTLVGEFACTLAGPPAVYIILASPDLATWSQLGKLSNTLGAEVFTDTGATNSPRRFYRAMTSSP